MQTPSLSARVNSARPHHVNSPRPTARLRRIATVLAAAGALLLGFAPAAAAHVTVNTEKAVSAGSYAKLTFRVPTESDTASTTKLTVTLPADTPLPSVSLMRVPGWTAETERTTFDPPLETGRFVLEDAITSITWTADEGHGIAPGEFAEFAISVGPLPEADTLVFPAAQEYSDGTVVHWDEVAAGDEHPDRPAPQLVLTTAGDTAAAPHHAEIDSPEAATQLLGALGLAVGAVALVLALWAFVRSGRRKEQV